LINIKIISVGKKVPSWVQSGYQEYLKRLPHELNLKLKEIPPARRGKNISIDKIVKQEALAILKDIPENYHIVVLDERGKKQTTVNFSKKINLWMNTGQDTCFIIGGPDGLDCSVIEAANEKWSFSDYTLPHALVRVFLVEQIYRAWCILKNHPYHRE
jgi:23S rRNA (pseudouridine1915-N3)-methyltransferase